MLRYTEEEHGLALALALSEVEHELQTTTMQRDILVQRVKELEDLLDKAAPSDKAQPPPPQRLAGAGEPPEPTTEAGAEAPVKLEPEVNATGNVHHFASDPNEYVPLSMLAVLAAPPPPAYVAVGPELARQLQRSLVKARRRNHEYQLNVKAGWRRWARRAPRAGVGAGRRAAGAFPRNTRWHGRA